MGTRKLLPVTLFSAGIPRIESIAAWQIAVPYGNPPSASYLQATLPIFQVTTR